MGEVELSLLRPSAPEDLLDEEAFEHDEFLPYWAELWPAASALAAALPGDLGVSASSSSAAAWECPRWSQPPEAPKSSPPTGPPTRSTCSSKTPSETASHSRQKCGTGATPGKSGSISPSQPTCSTSCATSTRSSTRCSNWPPTALIGLAGRPYEQQFLTPRRVDRNSRARGAGSNCRSLTGIEVQTRLRDLSHTKAHRRIAEV